MEFDLKTIGIYAGILLLGYILGLVESRIKQKSKDRKEEQTEDSEPIEKIVYLPSPDGEPNYALAITEKEAGKIEIKLDGEILENRMAVAPNQQKRLLSLIVALRPWVAANAAPADPIVSAEPVSTPSPAPPVTAAAEPVAMPGDEEKSPPVSDLSMVEQIDKILQNNLDGHSLKKMGIRLQESITGGVNFYVGLTRYEFIDEIPDQDVQAFIQKAISEWEENATPS